ncbi:MAG: D-beta-hydroxybutyrate dehydrogenase [Desulfobacterales bacterium RIFOXYA12_FULL_46_15]|nr:MAG: D-beta-hydroxybutyrate dehydrogenase [Desulfobacula sp. GWF2_41_7]OGR22150.1 MAG: D-beta-hydroxybutyrate dehydrogenase [Desulfobacterales bacterium RIFOXYA12_FULL_46_15]
MLIKEPEINYEETLMINDKNFNTANVCIVTGSGTGIGRAVAIAAAKNRLMTIGLDINETEGRKTQKIARDSGGQMVFIKTDLCNDEDIQTAVQEAGKLGQIKYLANVAGIQHINSVEDFPMEKYDLMQRLMLRAPFLLSKLVIPYMKKSPDRIGVIANMASIHGHICTMNKPAYNITKFGLRALSQSISAEGNGEIRSFTVSTGFVRTPLAEKQIEAQAEQRGISKEDVIKNVMMGKSRIKEMMTPMEAANLIIFGFSHHSRYLVGGDLLFDGGCVLTY